jgi:hypothetical protein
MTVAVRSRLPDRSSPTGCHEGNPIRSIDGNNLIRRVKRKEVQKQGVLSKTKRALTEAEFPAMQKILQNHDKNYFFGGALCLL